MPPFEKWEQRTGASLGWSCERDRLRSAGRRRLARTPQTELVHRPYQTAGSGVDNFYPGMFIQFNSKKTTGKEKDSAIFIIRGNSYRTGLSGTGITEPGLVDAGHVVHARRPGALLRQPRRRRPDRRRPHLLALFVWRDGHRVNTLFFNVVNIDDGRTWSTPVGDRRPGVLHDEFATPSWHASGRSGTLIDKDPRTRPPAAIDIPL